MGEVQDDTQLARALLLLRAGFELAYLTETGAVEALAEK